MDSYGVGHRKEVEKPKTRKQRKTQLAREALAAALQLREARDHLRGLTLQGSPLERALERGADLLEQMAREDWRG